MGAQKKRMARILGEAGPRPVRAGVAGVRARSRGALGARRGGVHIEPIARDHFSGIEPRSACRGSPPPSVACVPTFFTSITGRRAPTESHCPPGWGPEHRLVRQAAGRPTAGPRRQMMRTMAPHQLLHHVWDLWRRAGSALGRADGLRPSVPTRRRPGTDSPSTGGQLAARHRLRDPHDAIVVGSLMLRPVKRLTDLVEAVGRLAAIAQHLSRGRRSARSARRRGHGRAWSQRRPGVGT